MKDQSLEECIALLKNGKKHEARQLLQSLLQSDLENLKGWYWFVETFDTPEQKVKALRVCLRFNPDNQKVKDAIQTLETKYSQTATSRLVGNKITPNKVQPSRSKKNSKNLWIIGSVLGIGIISIICILAVGVLVAGSENGLKTPAPTRSIQTIIAGTVAAASTQTATAYTPTATYSPSLTSTSDITPTESLTPSPIPIIMSSPTRRSTYTPTPDVLPTSIHPSGASALCNDGTYSYSSHRRGTCSHHGGVSVWLENLPP